MSEFEMTRARWLDLLANTYKAQVDHGLTPFDPDDQESLMVAFAPGPVIVPYRDTDDAENKSLLVITDSDHMASWNNEVGGENWLAFVAELRKRLTE